MSERHKLTALSRVGVHTIALAVTENERQREIARALHHGATWVEVADALDVTPQSAHRRYRWLRYDPQPAGHGKNRPFPSNSPLPSCLSLHRPAELADVREKMS